MRPFCSLPPQPPLASIPLGFSINNTDTLASSRNPLSFRCQRLCWLVSASPPPAPPPTGHLPDGVGIRDPHGPASAPLRRPHRPATDRRRAADPQRPRPRLGPPLSRLWPCWFSPAVHSTPLRRFTVTVGRHSSRNCGDRPPPLVRQAVTRAQARTAATRPMAAAGRRRRVSGPDRTLWAFSHIGFYNAQLQAALMQRQPREVTPPR